MDIIRKTLEQRVTAVIGVNLREHKFKVYGIESCTLAKANGVPLTCFEHNKEEQEKLRQIYLQPRRLLIMEGGQWAYS